MSPILIKFCELKVDNDNINFPKFQLAGSYTLGNIAIWISAYVSKNDEFAILLIFNGVFLT